MHDGSRADPRDAGSGAIAVVIAPGPPLARADGALQRRPCAAAPCDARGCSSTPCPGREGNDAFVDRNDAQPAHERDGFVAGPVLASDGAPRVNDRVLAIAYADLMPRIMARVALEAAHCVRLAAAATGTLPPPETACGALPWGRLPAPAPPHRGMHARARGDAGLVARMAAVRGLRAAPALRGRGGECLRCLTDAAGRAGLRSATASRSRVCGRGPTSAHRACCVAMATRCTQVVQGDRASTVSRGGAMRRGFTLIELRWRCW